MFDATSDSYGWGRITIESKTIGSVSGSDQSAGNYSNVYGSGLIGLTIGPASVVYNSQLPLIHKVFIRILTTKKYIV